MKICTALKREHDFLDRIKYLGKELPGRHLDIWAPAEYGDAMGAFFDSKAIGIFSFRNEILVSTFSSWQF